MKTTELKDKELNQVSGGVNPNNIQNNDTNTDVDRDDIQKEINAGIQQIDDDALLPFN